MAFILAYNPATYSIVSQTTQNASYPASNIADFTHMVREYRTVTSSTGVNVWIDFGAAITLAGVMIDACNVSSGYYDGSSLSSAVTSTNLHTFSATALDIRVNRFKVYTPFTNFNFRYMRLVIAGAPSDTNAFFKIGRLVPFQSQVSLTRSPSLGYTYSANYPEPVINQFKSGGVEVISQGNNKIFQCNMNFIGYPSSLSSELWEIDNIKPNDLCMIYENDTVQSATNISHCYLCRRVENIKVTRNLPTHDDIANLSLIEVI